MPKKDSHSQSEKAADPAPTKIAALWRYPDATVLAQLVAQPRFASLSDERAIGAALLLVHKCQAAINHDDYYWHEEGKINEEWEAMPKPDKFPAMFKDFCQLIVRGKDEADNCKRYRDYCRECSGRWAAFCGGAVPEDPNEHFTKRRTNGFPDESTWYFEALGYLDYWKRKRQEDKRRAGRARQNKYRRNKKAPQAA